MSRQYITGADFSLERFTESVPEDGRYYLLQDGNVVEIYDTNEEAQQAYHLLCFTYWSRMLVSDDIPSRLQAARGLLARNRQYRPALEMLATCGEGKERAYAVESLKRLDRQTAAAG